MAKNNNNMIIGIVVAVVVVIAIVIGVIVGNNNKVGDNGGQSGDNGGGTSSVDYSDVDVSVGFGDYEVMEAQAKAIQNGEMTGKIIQVDGIVSHPIKTYSIVERNENGNAVGTEFIIDGVDESNYPQDGEHIIITGEIVEKEPLY